MSGPWVYMHGHSEYTYLPERLLLLLLLQRKQTVISVDPSLGTWADAPKDLMGLCSVGLSN